MIIILDGNYRYYNPDLGHNIIVNVTETPKNYMFKLIANDGKFRDNRFDAMFAKSPKIRIKKEGSHHEIIDLEDNTFSLDLYRNGVPYLFEKLGPEMEAEARVKANGENKPPEKSYKKLKGLYRSRDFDECHDIILEVDEKESKYVFKVVEDKTKYATGLFSMTLKKSENISFYKEGGTHVVVRVDNDDSWFTLYPYRMGMPFLFEKINDDNNNEEVNENERYGN